MNMIDLMYPCLSVTWSILENDQYVWVGLLLLDIASHNSGHSYNAGLAQADVRGHFPMKTELTIL